MLSTNPKPPLWALADAQSFYCSCERLFRADLEGKPVVVLSNNDGCLIALTPEAKALGYKMGDVYFQRERELKRDGVAVFSSNYSLYGDLSRRVMMTMESVVPEIDQYSIDEAFIPLYPALAAQAEDVGWTIHDRVKQWVGVPVRVGIGATRTLAKLANFAAKRKSRVYKADLGSAELEELLEETATEDIWGIGRRFSAKLARMGITNARQLRDMDASLAKKHLSVVGQRTVLELRGIQCIMEDLPAPRKTLISSRSFGRRVVKKEDIAQALAMHCTLAGERLRAEGMEAQGMCVWAETSRHMDEPYSRMGGQINLHIPTNITSELIAASTEILDRCYYPGQGYMKGGVMLYELVPADRRQRTLDEAAVDEGRQRRRDLMCALDQINDKFGRNTMRYLSEGPKDAYWHMRRNLMSGYLTTRWEDLPTVKL